MRRKKYFDWEAAFRFIRENVDRDGIWHGDAVSLAAEFEVPEETAREVLDELRQRQLTERLYTGSFYLSNWREKDDPGIRDQ
jgi:hypothetical protein